MNICSRDTSPLRHCIMHPQLAIHCIMHPQLAIDNFTQRRCRREQKRSSSSSVGASPGMDRQHSLYSVCRQSLQIQRAIFWLHFSCVWTTGMDCAGWQDEAIASCASGATADASETGPLALHMRPARMIEFDDLFFICICIVFQHIHRAFWADVVTPRCSLPATSEATA